jgi:hypothetical protein
MDGNAIVTTQGAGGPVATEIYLQSVQTSSETMFDDNQVKRGISYRPIRRAEAHINFTAVWSLKNYNKMDQFQETIRNHYNLIAQGNDTPMELVYPANFLTELLSFKGWIESVQKQFVRFQDVFIRNYRMNMLMPDYLTSIADLGSNGSLMNPNNVDYYGTKWYSVSIVDQFSLLSNAEKSMGLDPLLYIFNQKNRNKI